MIYNNGGEYNESVKSNRTLCYINKNGIKTIETRSWKTSYRGKLYIHASSTKIPKAYKENQDLMSLVDINNLNYGNIICSCDLVDCVEMTDEFINDIKKNKKNEYITGIYSNGRYAWIFKNIEILDNPIKAKGHLGIWNFS